MFCTGGAVAYIYQKNHCGMYGAVDINFSLKRFATFSVRKEKNVSFRRSAFMVAIDRVAKAELLRGL